MNNRAILLDSLQRAIQGRNSEIAAKFISLIQDSDVTALLGIDDKRRSLLHLALEFGVKDIAYSLLALQKNDNDIIFNKDDNNLTLLHLAVMNNYDDIVEQLLAIAIEKQQVNIFLGKENAGETVLHKAIGHENIIELILTKLSLNGNLVGFINVADKNGDTALHFALKAPGNKSASLLIKHDAKLNLHNNKNETAFSLFCGKSQERQISIFTSVNQSKQTLFLNYYRSHLINNIGSEEIKANYFKLASLHGLKALMIAHHEFGDIPVRSSYVRTQRLQDLQNSNGIYPVAEEEVQVPSGILDLVPRYAQQMPVEEPRDQELLINDDDLEIINEANDPQTEDVDDTLDKDRSTLTELITEIEVFIANLQNPTRSIVAQRLSIIVPLLLMIPYVIIESWYGYEEKKWKKIAENDNWRNQPANNELDDYSIKTFLFGAFGSFPFMIAGLLIYFLFHSIGNIVLRREWEPLLNKLQAEVVDRLSLLEDREKATNENCLPTDPQNIRKFKDEISNLNNINLPFIGYIEAKYNSVYYMLEILPKLNDLLLTVREDMNLTRKPISFFSKPNVVVNIEDDLEGDEMPLLRKSR